jgi:hypothetical protein
MTNGQRHLTDDMPSIADGVFRHPFADDKVCHRFDDVLQRRGETGPSRGGSRTHSARNDAHTTA